MPVEGLRAIRIANAANEKPRTQQAAGRKIAGSRSARRSGRVLDFLALTVEREQRSGARLRDGGETLPREDRSTWHCIFAEGHEGDQRGVRIGREFGPAVVIAVAGLESLRRAAVVEPCLQVRLEDSERQRALP